MAAEPLAAQSPSRRPLSRWWMALLVASLAVNLLIGGAAAVRFLAPEQFERFTGSGYSPLIPRKFLADLPAERRKELGDLLKRNRTAFRKDFAEMRKLANELADALAREPYDEAAVIAAIENHAKIAQSMVARGAEVTIEVVRKLDPEERALLAKRIRERAGRRK
jgi:uncharacterized membrane protein